MYSMNIQPRAVLHLAGVFALGALLVLSTGCKSGGSGSASLPSMSLASTIDQGAVADEALGMKSLGMASPSGGQVPVVSLVDSVKEKLGAKAAPCVAGEGRACAGAAPTSGDAKGPHRDVHGAQATDDTGLAGRAK